MEMSPNKSTVCSRSIRAPLFIQLGAPIEPLFHQIQWVVVRQKMLPAHSIIKWGSEWHSPFFCCSRHLSQDVFQSLAQSYCGRRLIREKTTPVRRRDTFLLTGPHWSGGKSSLNSSAFVSLDKSDQPVTFSSYVAGFVADLLNRFPKFGTPSGSLVTSRRSWLWV
jgi:hypothetical protein